MVGYKKNGQGMASKLSKVSRPSQAFKHLNVHEFFDVEAHLASVPSILGSYS